ncbi:hypothetical protein DPMN_033759 [Dreissena polymorpha]|uniref:Uncharacterized protein n=1 Tax=Dreissena polymorpha TaxID=45954 RepID=A0A9D4RJ44_DREPO|nr:hypothetical protein DPMN_033759 [Dreissena polymorpha]
MQFQCFCSAAAHRQPSAILKHTYAVREHHIHLVGTENVLIYTQVHDGVVMLTAHQHRVTRPYTTTTRLLYVLISDCSRCDSGCHTYTMCDHSCQSVLTCS